MREGRLVPDEIVCQLVHERLMLEDCVERGFLLDGFPRNLSQAIMLRKTGVEIHGVVFLDVARSVLMERILGRVVDSVTGISYHLKRRPPPAGRMRFIKRRRDDTAEVGRHRLKIYAKLIKPLLAHFKRQPKIVVWKFRVTDVDRSADSLFTEIAQAIDNLRRNLSQGQPCEQEQNHLQQPRQSPRPSPAQGQLRDSNPFTASRTLCGHTAVNGCGERSKL